MNLYLDLKKAVSQMPATGKDTPLEDQSTAEHKATYSRRYEGVASGESLDPDDPDVGGKWPHSDEDSNLAEVEAERESREENDDDDEKKEDAAQKAVQTLQLMSKSLRAEHERRQPNPREREFLVDVLGYTHEDVNKGVAVIDGKNRGLFNRWLCDKLRNSTSRLSKSVGASFV